ncbi:MAG: PaaI family thioesterase [Desulfobacterales bacterium]|jgi:acyl-CoA thioesterase|nr:PaaI family thioesterase [Desulfobacteraceae bacterium]MBT7086451.1 PaaI family thioesterase [Desulfobacterales bacterium]MBT7696870.1 PaaI family thioesterase [Desulfobacterales bacterium]
MKHQFAELIGLVFENIDKGRSICKIEIKDELFNPHNVVHGGVLYSMADTGMGGALYPLLESDEICATIEIKISYFNPVRKGLLECSTTLLNKGKTIASLESVVLNNGVLAAKASGSYSIFKPYNTRQKS